MLNLPLRYATQYYMYNYVAGNFFICVGLIFVFLLFFGMVMYASEVETKKKSKLTEKKN